MKTLQIFVPEVPKLQAGESATRARRLLQWFQQVTQALEPAGHHVTSWWTWVRLSAHSTHIIFLTKPLDQQDQIYPQELVPPHFAEVESWMRPRILACLPNHVRDWVDLWAQTLVLDQNGCQALSHCPRNSFLGRGLGTKELFTPRFVQ